MIKIHSLKHWHRFTVAFAVVLCIRSLGLLALFQHTPTVEGLSNDKQFAKKVLLFKKDLPTEGASRVITESRVPVFGRVEIKIALDPIEQELILRPLRAPPTPSPIRL